MSKVSIIGNPSGTGTLSISAPNTNTNRTLALPDADGTVVTGNGATNTLPTGSVTNSQLAFDGGALGFRNKIINGACEVAQRGAIAFSTNQTLLYGGCDRIFMASYGFTTISGNLQQSILTQIGESKLAQNIALSTTGSGVLYLGTRLESKDVAHLSGRTITFTCDVLHNFGSSTNFRIRIAKANSADNFSDVTSLFTSGDFSITNSTATKITYTVTLGEFDADNGLQVLVYVPTLGAVTSKYMYVGNWQLEEGPTATPFEHRPYGAELALCLRYYQNFGSSIAFVNSNSTPIQFAGFWPVPMRSSPSVSAGGSVGPNSVTALGYTVSVSAAQTSYFYYVSSEL